MKNPDRLYDYFIDAIEDVTLPPSISSKDHLQNYAKAHQSRQNDSPANMFESFLKFGNRMNGVESSDSLLSAKSSSGRMLPSSQDLSNSDQMTFRNILSAVDFLTLRKDESSTSLSSDSLPSSPRSFTQGEQAAFTQEGHALYPLYMMFTMIDAFLLNQKAEERV